MGLLFVELGRAGLLRAQRLFDSPTASVGKAPKWNGSSAGILFAQNPQNLAVVFSGSGLRVCLVAKTHADPACGACRVCVLRRKLVHLAFRLPATPVVAAVEYHGGGAVLPGLAGDCAQCEQTNP